MPRLPTCSLYGLRVGTELPLGGAPSADGEPDVVVRFGPARSLATRPPRPGCFEASPGHVFLGTLGGGVVLARHGREILVDGDDREALTSLVLGQGLATILHQRGVLTLHASAVAVEGGAVAFLGDQGAGKSTTAAALVERGGRLITDDVLPVRNLDAAAPSVAGGYPFLKVTQDTAQALDDDLNALRPAYSAVAKWRKTVSTVSTACPLRAVYVLEPGLTLHTERLSILDAFQQVAHHAFTGAIARSTGSGDRCLRSYAALARYVPLFRLTVPRSLDELPRLADSVVTHARSVATPSNAGFPFHHPALSGASL
ncbi:hypothetical protein [Rubrivirga litoralis]|uniref:Hpr(Ser) kinase/phosphatase n=1 Tax=Rubrivirga litoralis TaxID=3075598 RepID=A0ABU3BLK1_9BACT|nr:hypothetical protein [Rubrivirga sp. F394]MDT0630169.1 hypothetical protein [Rubrivirga sp. F394]